MPEIITANGSTLSLQGGLSLFQRWRALEKASRSDPAFIPNAAAARAAYEIDSSPEERLRDAESELTGTLENARIAAARGTKISPETQARIAAELRDLQARVDASRAEVDRSKARVREIAARVKLERATAPTKVTKARDPGRVAEPPSLAIQALTLAALTAPFWGAVLLTRRT